MGGGYSTEDGAALDLRFLNVGNTHATDCKQLYPPRTTNH
jgi:hypothetical protein